MSELPEWVQPVFPFEALNRIQSVVYPAAFQTDESLLICAPTSAGKTNIAMLSLLREFPDFAIDLMRIVADRLETATQRLAAAELALEQMEGRG